MHFIYVSLLVNLTKPLTTHYSPQRITTHLKQSQVNSGNQDKHEQQLHVIKKEILKSN